VPITENDCKADRAVHLALICKHGGVAAMRSVS